MFDLITPKMSASSLQKKGKNCPCITRLSETAAKIHEAGEAAKAQKVKAEAMSGSAKGIADGLAANEQAMTGQSMAAMGTATGSGFAGSSAAGLTANAFPLAGTSVSGVTEGMVPRGQNDADVPVGGLSPDSDNRRTQDRLPPLADHNRTKNESAAEFLTIQRELNE